MSLLIISWRCLCRVWVRLVEHMRLICMCRTINCLTHDLHHCQAGGFFCALTDVTMSWLNILLCLATETQKRVQEKKFFKVTSNSLMCGTVISALAKVSVFITLMAKMFNFYLSRQTHIFHIYLTLFSQLASFLARAFASNAPWQCLNLLQWALAASDCN